MKHEFCKYCTFVLLRKQNAVVDTCQCIFVVNGEKVLFAVQFLGTMIVWFQNS